MNPEVKEMLKKMLEASEEQRMEMARKSINDAIKLPEDQLVKQIESSMLAFSSLNDEDRKTLMRPQVIAANDLTPEKRSSLYAARVKAGLSVDEEITNRVLATGANILKEISEEGYQTFKREIKKACDIYNVPYPEFLK